MKNYQQTVKQRRVKLEKAKQMLRSSTPVFQPREAWESKQKCGGVALCVLEAKQAAAGHPGVNRTHSYRWWWW